jgi:acyl-coenzyme A thioesterase 13
VGLSAVAEAAAPAGFEPIQRRSPFLDLIGPVYVRRAGGRFVFGLRAVAKHGNFRGAVQGGVLMTLADIALGYNLAFAEEPPASIVTASFSADFLGQAALGAWLEVETEIVKRGARLSVAQCLISADGKPVLRASAGFAAVARPLGDAKPSE